MKRILLLCLTAASMLVSGELWAQDRTVSGRVTSVEDGSPLPGVNVVLKGTSAGTVTDAEGNYNLSIPAGDAQTLVFTFIGLRSEELAIENRTVIDLQMATDVTQLSEIVVTGANIEREKKSLGYRVESLRGSSVQQVSEADPLRALQGKVAGVNIISSSGVPGSATRITMRGNRSMLGDNQPLIVVDGIPYDNSQSNGTATSNSQLTGGGAFGTGFGSIDPNNIESMTILPPGGAGASIYGVRAANGVIVIVTKTGSNRIAKKGLEISVSSGFSVEELIGLPDYQNKYGSGTGFAYGQVNGSWGAPFPGTVPYPTIDQIPLWSDIAAAFPDAPATVPYRAHPNNVKDFFNNGILWDNSITLQGGNEKSTFTATASRTDQKGIVPESGLERTNISVGSTTILANNLTIGGSLSYNNRVQHGPPGGASNALGNGSAFARTMYLGRDWDLQGQPFENPLTKESVFFVARTQATNPYWSAKYDGFESIENRVVGNLNASYEFNDNFSFQYRIGINHFDQTTQEWFRPGGRAVGGVGSVTDTYETFTELDHFLKLNYNKKLSDNLTLNAFVGHNINQNTRELQSYGGTGLIDFNIIDMDNTTDVLSNGGFYERRRIVGVLGEVGLDLKDYLFVTLSGRNDWSSTLPVEHRSFFYPAASVAFIFTDALQLESQVLSFGKLRASWTKTGHDADPYQLKTTYTLNPLFVSQSVTFPFNGHAGTTLGDVATDPNLTPEFTQTIEFGTELQFFNKNASLDVAVYKSSTTKGIASQSYPAVSGFTNFLTNFGEISNKGIEATLNFSPINRPSGFRWNVNATFTHNTSVVESLAPGVEEVVILPLFAGGITPVLRPGQEYGIMRGTVDARDDEGNLLIDPGTGQLIRDLNPAIVGNPNPDFIAGLSNSFSYKGITLSVLFDWRQGGDVYSTTILSQLGRGVTRDTEDREMNRVIPGFIGDINTGEPVLDAEGNKIPNTIQTEVNDLYFGESFAVNSADEWNVFDGTYIKLREVSLGYDFPQSLLSKTPFGSARISLTGRNLWYHAPNVPPHSNFDPETSTFGVSNAQGFEFDNVPAVRRYGVNLRFTF